MENTAQPYKYADVETARLIMTNVKDLEAYSKDGSLCLEYWDQADTLVIVEIVAGFMQSVITVTHYVADGPRSRKEVEKIYSACLVSTLKYLNQTAAV